MFNEKCPLSGYFVKGRYIIVKGKEACEELRFLGSFGTHLEDAKRKDISRRGPSDKHLIESNPDKTETNTTILANYEAFFLAYSLGCLNIAFSDDFSENLMDIHSSWTEFRSMNCNSRNKLDFAVEYAAYHYFITRGWVVKSGENYGTHFLLYRDSPSIDHAHYAVLVIFCDDPLKNNSYNWQLLLTYNRVIQSVGKQLLITYVKPSCEESVVFTNPSCISKLRITNRMFNAQANTLSKKPVTIKFDL